MGILQPVSGADDRLGSMTSFQARSRHDRFTPQERTYPAVIGSARVRANRRHGGLGQVLDLARSKSLTDRPRGLHANPHDRIPAAPIPTLSRDGETR